MAGVGKLLKQAAKMQKKMEVLQEKLAQLELEVSSGGAIYIKINGQGEFLSLKLDPEFLKEDPAFVEEALLEAVKEAAAKAKEINEEEMSKVSDGFQFPGQQGGMNPGMFGQQQPGNPYAQQHQQQQFGGQQFGGHQSPYGAAAGMNAYGGQQQAGGMGAFGRKQTGGGSSANSGELNTAFNQGGAFGK